MSETAEPDPTQPPRPEADPSQVETGGDDPIMPPGHAEEQAAAEAEAEDADEAEDGEEESS